MLEILNSVSTARKSKRNQNSTKSHYNKMVKAGDLPAVLVLKNSLYCIIDPLAQSSPLATG